MAIRASVVVPTYKRTELLSRCLAALVQQDFSPGAYEIIVADDAASRDTECLVECWAQWARDSGRPVEICYVPVVGQQHGPAAARNRAWRAARGEIVAFTDDDCIPAPDWLDAGMSAIGDGAAAATGQVVVPLEAEPTDYEYNTLGLETAEFVTANCFCRREAIAAAGGFDERFRLAWREDSDLFFTLLERGERIVFAPDAIVVHPVRPAGWGVSLHQQRRNLYNALLYKKHRPLYARWIQASPRRRYYSTVGALLLALIAGARGPRPLALGAAGAWALMTAHFTAERLRETSHAPAHVAEMVCTSALIPPLSIYWRLRGALRWRVWYW